MHLGLGLQITRAYSAAPAPFTPASLGGLALWLTAAPAYCFQDADALVPCGDGDAVYLWKDRSGNGNDLVQATASLRPILFSLSGGLWTVYFDGVDDYMAAAVAVTSSLAFSMFGVIGLRDLVGGGNAKIAMNAGAGGYGFAISSNQRSVLYENVAFKLFGAATVDAFELWEAVRDTTLSTWVDGASTTTGVAGTPNAVGTPFLVGDGVGGGAPSTVDVTSLAFYPSALADADRQLLEAYFTVPADTP